MLKKIVKYLLFILLFLAILVFTLIGVIDRGKLSEQDYYRKMMSKLDTIQFQKYDGIKETYIGHAKINITPTYATPMAGYRPRKAFTAVKDSIYVRTLLIDNGSINIAFIAVDLLLFPPLVKEKVDNLLQSKNLNVFSYLGATHTHNSLGGWDNSIAGELSMGSYDPQMVEFIANKVVQSIENAMQNMQPGTISYLSADANQYVRNRLNPSGVADGRIKGIKINFINQKSAYLFTLGAHPTNLPMKSTYLSNDYPGQAIYHLEKTADCKFAMFMAGMVGSQSLTGFTEHNLDLISSAGSKFAEMILNTQATHPITDTLEIIHRNLKIEFPRSQMRLTNNLKVRNWAYNWAFGSLSGEIGIVRLNNIVFFSLPFDFSGEIFLENIQQEALQKNLKIIITGFNGDYAGYVINSKYYDQSKKEEATTMNWMGPQSEEYITTIINSLIEKM